MSTMSSNGTRTGEYLRIGRSAIGTIIAKAVMKRARCAVGLLSVAMQLQTQQSTSEAMLSLQDFSDVQFSGSCVANICF